jgi:ABC-2 type transport system ATP-binding protein
VEVEDLVVRLGTTTAVGGASLSVGAGEVVALLGPNGAGKTTTVEVLEGYRQRSAGEVSVLGEDPATAGRSWREEIGIVLQSNKLDPYLSVREALGLFAGYYRRPRPVEDVIELVGLGAKADGRTSRLSGGQQRRLDVGLALVGDPELLFLDEPTTGFDPSARRQAWDVIGGLRDLGKTVFLTTHYMDEAQHLADRVAIIARGMIVAEGHPRDLGDREHAPARISFRLPDGMSAADIPLEGAEAANGSVAYASTDPTHDLNRLTAWAMERGAGLDGLEVRRPTLEDVYLRLTGEEAEH